MAVPAISNESAPTERILAFLRDRGCERIVHPGGSLLDHLVRTSRRLDEWGASPALTAAALCHATYGTGGFHDALLGIDRRSDLVALIGPHAEALVYAYASYDRDFGGLANSGATLVRDRFTGVCFIPSEIVRRQLLELTCANEIDILTCGGPDAERYAPSIVELLVECRSLVNSAARADIDAALIARGRVVDDVPNPSDREIACRDEGNGATMLLLVHGGAGPELTWKTQMTLARSFRLKIPWRRGFGTSVWTDRQDWASDACDLLRIMPDGVHLVAHSYGAVGAIVAACRAPHRFASLTLIEPPLWSVAEDEPSVRGIAGLARAFAGGDVRARVPFLRLAGLDPNHPETAGLEMRALDHRDPGEACPPLDAIVAAKLPVLVVSGGHHEAMEIVGEALAKATCGEHWSRMGAGHAVQRSPEFNEKLIAFIDALRERAR